jgi:beta-xylosidase
MSLAARAGWLRLMAEPLPERARNLWGAANLLLQKLPAPEFSVTTRIDFSGLRSDEKAGLIVMGMNYSYLAIERGRSGFKLVKYSCINASEGNSETGETEAALPGATVVLKVSIVHGGFCEFSFSNDGRPFVQIGPRFKAREGKWIGAKVGLFCLGARAGNNGYADFDWFRFESKEE